MRETKQTLIYIAKRLALMVFTFIIIFIMCFCLIRVLPVNPTLTMGDSAGTFYSQMVAQGRYFYNTETGQYEPLPILTQLWNFLVNLFSPDGEYRFGISFSSQLGWLQEPPEILISRMGPTVIINVYSMIISIPLGIGIGIYMALKKNKWQDSVLSVIIMLVISVPSFVYAFLLQYYFGYVWKVLEPLANNASLYPIFSWEYTRYIALPVLSMCFGSIAGFARYTRAELTEVLTSDFMLLARTKGLTRAQATVRHALRNSMVPIFPMILGEIISVLSGSMIIEDIFAINGVGKLFLLSITEREYDVFQFVAMFYITIGLVGTLVIDVSYGIVDPRIRMGGKKA